MVPRYAVVLTVALAICPPLLRGAAAQERPEPIQRHLHALTSPRTYDGPPLTLAAAVEEALQRNPTLAALRQQYDAARLRPAQERFLMAPTFEAQIWQWPISTLNPANTNMYMLTMNQELPGRGKRQLRTALAEKDAELAGNDIAIRAREVIAQVKRAYADLFIARQAIDLHLASVDLLRQFADVSAAKYATGRISQQDVLKAVVEVSKLHEDLVMHEERAGNAAAQLNVMLDRPPQSAIGPLPAPTERAVLLQPDELQAIAVERQPELRTAQLQVERAQAALAVTQRDYKPDFFVGGGYMHMPRDRDAWTASIGMTWPNAPWARGRLDAKKAEATADIATAEARRRDTENNIRLAVHQAYLRVKAAEARADLLRTTVVPQSEHTLEVSRVAYQTDRVDFLAILDNQRMLLEARLGYYRALTEFDQALADLERTVGTEITTTTAESPTTVASGFSRTDGSSTSVLSGFSRTVPERFSEVMP